MYKRQEFDSSRPFDVLNRQELAKIMVNYVKNVNGGKVAAEGLTCDLTQYSDYSLLNEEMRGYVKQACEMGIMGRQNDRGGMIPAFRPFDPVTRAEFGAVLSRVMYGEANNTPDVAGWYKGHLTALNNAGILTKIDMPYAQEIRSWVWKMCIRDST